MTLTAERLRSLMTYNPETGIFVRLVSAGGRPAGSESGRPHPSTPTSYVAINVDGSRHYAHRLAWLYVHGEWPEGDIDHRDGNGANNAIGNLRDATESQNGANSRLSAANTTGLKGVSYDKARKKYRAVIMQDRRYIHIGRFSSAEEAYAARCDAAKRLHGTFARFA